MTRKTQEERIEAAERHLAKLKAKAQPTYRHIRSGARALYRAWLSLHNDETGEVRKGSEELATMLDEQMHALTIYYEQRGVRLLDGHPEDSETEKE